MNSLDTGKDKIKKICEILEIETLNPAKEEAARVVHEAEKRAQTILAQAEQNAQGMIERAKDHIEKGRMLFETNLKQAFNGIKEQLRQEIEKGLLNEALTTWVRAHASTPDIASRLITALVQMIQQGGIEGDFSALIPQHLSTAEVNALVGAEIVHRLKQGSVVVGPFHGGVQLKLHGQHLTLDLSESAIVELLVGYVSKEFRDIIFK